MRSRNQINSKKIFAAVMTSLFLTGCGVEVYHESETDSNHERERGPLWESERTYVYSDKTQDSDKDKSQDIFCDSTQEAAEADVIYSISRNSNLKKKTYEVGDHLYGEIMVSAFQYGSGRCSDSNKLNTADLYSKDIRNIWIEVTQLVPYKPAFIETYFVPEEAISFKTKSQELGLFIDPDFITLDNYYEQGAEFILRVMIENNNGTVTSASTWNNDMEAARSIGFKIAEDLSTVETETQEEGNSTALIAE